MANTDLSKIKHQFWGKGVEVHRGRGKVCPHAKLRGHFTEVSQHFCTSLQLQNITEFFSFVKEWHLQKHSSRAEGDVLIEGKENVLVVFFNKKKGAIACHKTSQLVHDPQQSSCSSCSHSRKIRVIYNFLPQFVNVQNVHLLAKYTVKWMWIYLQWN